MEGEGRHELEQMQGEIHGLTRRIEQLSARLEHEGELQRAWMVGLGLVTVTVVMAVAAVTGLIIPMW